MSYELFQQGAGVYIPVILISFVITILAYGIVPFVLARTRKKSITKRKYNFLCYSANFFVMIAFIVINGESAGFPYFLWTWIFTRSGLKTLTDRGLLKEKNIECVETIQNQVEELDIQEKTENIIKKESKSKGGSTGSKTYKAMLLVLVVLVTIALGVSIYQVYGLRSKSTEQLIQIDTLQKRIDELELMVDKNNKTISRQARTITNLKSKADIYDEMCESLSYGNIGKGSKNFKVDESLIVVRKNEKDKKFTLTTNWSGQGTVSVSYSSTAATVDFDKDSWGSSVKMTVKPWRVGATVVTFSTDAKADPFKMLIVVVE